MGKTVRFKRWQLMTAATEALMQAGSLAEILEILRSDVRAILRSDGVTVIMRERNQVHYVGEDAIAPLWTGQRFPIGLCVSGMAMTQRRTIVIPDIRADPRVPIDAYQSTFVSGMAIVPIGIGKPVAAIGAYWRSGHPIDEDALVLLDMLAKGAGAQFERIVDQEIKTAS
jgi:GAF domain-containing protein